MAVHRILDRQRIHAGYRAICREASMATIHLKWMTPVLLTRHDEYIYWTDDYARIPETHGLYIFARRHGSNINPIYIGRSRNIRNRIFDHLESNVPLMNRLLHEPNGDRLVLFGVYQPCQGMNPTASIRRAESVLIKDAISNGYDLVNLQGTSILYDELLMDGPVSSRGPFQRTMRLQR